MSSSLVTFSLSVKKTNNTGHYGKIVKVKGFYLFWPQFEMKGSFWLSSLQSMSTLEP